MTNAEAKAYNDLARIADALEDILKVLIEIKNETAAK